MSSDLLGFAPARPARAHLDTTTTARNRDSRSADLPIGRNPARVGTGPNWSSALRWWYPAPPARGYVDTTTTPYVSNGVRPRTASLRQTRARPDVNENYFRKKTPGKPRGQGVHGDWTDPPRGSHAPSPSLPAAPAVGRGQG